MTTESENVTGFKCPHLDKCPFFHKHQDTMSVLAQKLKDAHCLHDNTHCARLWIRQQLGKDAVPLQMMPHQQDWAEQILRDAGKTETIYHRTTAAQLR